MSFRAEQVGSLLRPPDLLEARTAYAERRIDQPELRAREDQAIRQAVGRQRDLGLDICTDGEMRRGSWLTNMAEAVEGFVPGSTVLHEWHGPGGGVERSTIRVAGAKLRKTRPLTRDELPLLKTFANVPFKITLPAPSCFALAGFQEGTTDKVYATRRALLDDLVPIIRDEIQWLVGEGVRYIQLDAPYYSHYLDPRQREVMRQGGQDPDRAFADAVAGDNDSLRGVRREGVTLAVHVCRGNSRSRWYTEGGYDAIAEQLFGLLDVDRFLLEYDSDRAGGFAPLRLVPAGKDIVLGLVTSKASTLERPDDLRRRIDDAARYVPLDHLALSPQCGFASIAAGNLLSADDQWRKLELVVDTARVVWGGA